MKCSAITDHTGPFSPFGRSSHAFTLQDTQTSHPHRQGIPPGQKLWEMAGLSCLHASPESSENHDREFGGGEEPRTERVYVEGDDGGEAVTVVTQTESVTVGCD